MIVTESSTKTSLIVTSRINIVTSITLKRLISAAVESPLLAGPFDCIVDQICTGIQAYTNIFDDCYSLDHIKGSIG